MKFLATLIVLAIICPAALGQTPTAREAFKTGFGLLEAGQPYAAIDQFKLVTKDTSYPLIDYAYYYIAEAYRQKNARPEAIQVYNIVITYFKNSTLVPVSYITMAEVQADNNDFSAGATTLHTMLVSFPKDALAAKARYLLGVYLVKLGQNEEAARVFRNIDLLHKDSYFAEKAIEQLDKLAKTSSLALYEAPAAEIYNLGIKYFKNGDKTKAKGYFNRLAKFYRKSTFYDEALLMLGRLQLRQGDLKSAEHYFRQVINLDKDAKPSAMYYLARTYEYKDNQAAAVSLLEKLTAQYPNSYCADEALYFLGKYYGKKGQAELAGQAFAKLVSNYPNSEYFDEASWAIGSSLFKSGNYTEAYTVFKKINSARTLFWSAKCATKANETAQAIDDYKATISRFDHSYYAYRAREELQKIGINIKLASVPDVPEAPEPIGSNSYDSIPHEQKYQELIALDLGDQAAQEAAFIEDIVPTPQKDKASLAKYHAYVSKGKFAKPIYFADQKILEAATAGKLDSLDPRFWRFAYPRGYWSFVEKYAREYQLDPYLVYAVIREESRFNSRALSHSQAYGLMQIIPSTGRLIARAIDLRYSSFKMYEPRVNIEMGTYYLASLIKRFNGNVPLALAGYNGGPVRIKKWLKNYQNFDLDEFIEDIPITETRNYVKKVMKSYYGYQRTYSSQ